MKYSSLIFLFAFSVNLFAQGVYKLYYNDTIKVKENSSALDNPWAGGMNSMQFSHCDFDLDGKLDLFVFDRTGNRIMPFLNTGSANQAKYTYAPQYIEFFPPLEQWVLMRDFNCDGKMDIFSYAPGGMKVYKNTSNGYLSFQLMTNLLLSNYQPNVINLYVTGVDIPAIDDIDGDGDLDILTFEIFGSWVEYHRNLSMETKGNCDSLHYELRNACWGKFRENQLNCSIILNQTCGFNVPNPERKGNPQGNKHSGSCLFTIETNNNNAREVVLGDVSCKHLTHLTNGDAVPNQNATMSAADTTFPKNFQSTVPVSIEVFPCGFHIDVNNNSLKDLLVSPNNSGVMEQENFESVWRYNNTGTNSQPNFVLVEKNFLQGGMIETGEGANPTLADIDGDGLLDLIIGNHSYFDSTGAMLSFYKNTGTNQVPEFTLITRNLANLPAYNLTPFNTPTRSVTPTFGDIDNDGEVEMIIGDQYGNLHLFENNGGNFTLAQANYLSITDEFATPQLYDLNGDSLLDLVIGARNGNVFYYENTGTKSAPVFTFVTDSLGKVSAKDPWNFFGFSYPHFYNSNGSTRLVLGAAGGYYNFYDNIDNNLNGKFNRVDSAYMDLKMGRRATVTGAYLIGNDTLYDLILGNYSGGLTLYSGGYFNSLTEYPESKSDYTLYPVPASDRLHILFSEKALLYTKPPFAIYNIVGQQVLSGVAEAGGIDVSTLPSGTYIFRLIMPEQSLLKAKKFTITR